MITWHPPAELKAQADSVVEVLILAAEAPESTFRSQRYPYRVEIIRVVAGDRQTGEALVHFEDLLPHRRGESRVCPRKKGTGIEASLAVGQRYRLYLGEAFQEILLAEVDVAADVGTDAIATTGPECGPDAATCVKQ